MLKSLIVLMVVLYALFTGVPDYTPPAQIAAPETAVSAGVDSSAQTETDEKPAVEEYTPAPEPEPIPPEPALEPEPAVPPQEMPEEQPAQTEQEAVVGSWLWELDTAPIITAMFKHEVPDAGDALEYSELKLVINIRLFEDGSFTAIIEEESAWAWREGFIAQTEELLLCYVEIMMAENGINMSVESFMAMSGISLTDVMEELANEVLSEETIQGMLSVGRGNYAVWDGKVSLYWGTLDENSYDYYTLKDDTIIIEEGTGMIADFVGISEFGEFVSMVYPAVLTRTE